MRRLLISAFACAIVVLGFLSVGAAQAGSIVGISFPTLHFAEVAAETATAKDLMTQLETEVLPQLENILSPEQRETFKTSVADGTSFRKAFKSLTLTPGQKAQLKTLLKSMPKQDAFASLTPDQKKKLFMKNKELFIPTPEEITEKISAGMKKKEGLIPTPEEIGEKINAGMKAAKAKMEEFAPSSQEITDKISAGMKKKEEFIPTPEEIGEKISAGMKAGKAEME